MSLLPDRKPASICLSATQGEGNGAMLQVLAMLQIVCAM
jgi:hypothetical protein